MSGLRGRNFVAELRSSNTVWKMRPHAKNKAARKAWDHFSQVGVVASIQLTKGIWTCVFTNGEEATSPADLFSRDYRA